MTFSYDMSIDPKYEKPTYPGTGNGLSGGDPDKTEEVSYSQCARVANPIPNPKIYKTNQITYSNPRPSIV